MRERGVRAVLAAWIVSIPPMIVVAGESGVGEVSWWGSGGAGSLGLAEAVLLAGMLLAGRARRRLLGRARLAARCPARANRPERTPAPEVVVVSAEVPTLSTS